MMFGLIKDKDLVVFIPSQLVFLVRGNAIRFKNIQEMRKKYSQYEFWGFRRVSRSYAQIAL
jgi:hypothetical protein